MLIFAVVRFEKNEGGTISRRSTGRNFDDGVEENSENSTTGQNSEIPVAISPVGQSVTSTATAYHHIK